MASEYDKTLNLPKTEFPMRANLANRERELYGKQDKEKLYDKIMDRNREKPLYVLHDGPPYANGKIHLGTALNKILKDFIVKQKNMSGYKAPFVPGFDVHGLPIELHALKQAGEKSSDMSTKQLRKMCAQFAKVNVESQVKQFKQLGVIGDYDNPYITMDPEFEAKQIEVFGKMASKNYIYKGLKPVYWCRDCATALAEAEIEYALDECHSIYVNFQVDDDKGKFSKYNIDKDNINFVIWTTTPWTLPGNVAVCLGPKYDYVLLKSSDEYYIMAQELVNPTVEIAGIDNYEIVDTFKGSELEYITLKHPFLNRKSLVITGDHVTLESGTGCVHTAPGHGVDDYEVCKKYPSLEIVVPVDEKGILTDEAGKYAGLEVDVADREIIKDLKNDGKIYATQDITHQYPHCWRCKQPILFRATNQWFCSVEAFKDEALKEIEKVKWIPSWGETRIRNMVADRSDWCISRQRKWGVPIPIIYCKKCDTPIINSQTIEAIVELYKKEGSDGWFDKQPQEFLPDGFKCDCGCDEFYKETDIMDVWFDSGCSHAAVLETNKNLRWPADLYLEGADQFRGWFQSSLLTAVAVKGESPYKAVCTNGWVVDGQGRKMSKSLKNGVAPEKIVSQYGADILRLWVASCDYHSDVRISNEILKQLCEVYRKIRNTARFILGNLEDFNPKEDMIEIKDFKKIDRWAIAKTNELIEYAHKNYNDFSFYNIYHAIHNFCTIDMSNFYLDIIKDRLYCDGKRSNERLSAQSAMYHILSALCRILSPILSFTAQEIWSFMPHTEKDNEESVFLNDMPRVYEMEGQAEILREYDDIKKYKDIIAKELEEKRANKVIGSSLEAHLTIYAKQDKYEYLSLNAQEIQNVCLVSKLEIVKVKDDSQMEQGRDIFINTQKIDGEKCERCWSYRNTVGNDKTHPTLCKRCADVVNKID